MKRVHGVKILYFPTKVGPNRGAKAIRIQNCIFLTKAMSSREVSGKEIKIITFSTKAKPSRGAEASS